MMQSQVERLLSGPSVRMKDRAAVAEKLTQILTKGSDKLQVISDFDYTLSRFSTPDGTKCWTTHAVFDNEAGKLDPTLGKTLNALRDKFLPIEFDPDLTQEEKLPHMLEWWSTAHGLIAKSSVSRPVLKQFVQDSSVHLRDSCVEFLSLLEKEKVPLIVFSAGIGDLIEMVFERDLARIPPNMHIISNMMKFNEEEKVVGFEDPLIHTFNKNSSVVTQERDFFHKLVNRDQILLLGDSLGDLHMDVGVENEGNVLKIGFLNFAVERLLPRYLEGYDIVLVEDHSMGLPHELLQLLAKKQ